MLSALSMIKSLDSKDINLNINLNIYLAKICINLLVFDLISVNLYYH